MKGRHPPHPVHYFISTETEGKSSPWWWQIHTDTWNIIKLHFLLRIGGAGKTHSFAQLDIETAFATVHCRSLLLPLRTQFPPARCFTDIKIKPKRSAGCQLQSTNLRHKFGRSVLCRPWQCASQQTAAPASTSVPGLGFKTHRKTVGKFGLPCWVSLDSMNAGLCKVSSSNTKPRKPKLLLKTQVRYSNLWCKRQPFVVQTYLSRRSSEEKGDCEWSY